VSPHLIVHIAAGALIVALSIPLILRKVPPNHAYGVRIPKAFESERNWYDINAYGGKLLLVFGIVLIVYGIVMRPFAPEAKSIWTLLYVIAPLLLVLPMLVMILAYARRLP
jgi:uncharacterized membrane protein